MISTARTARAVPISSERTREPIVSLNRLSKSFPARKGWRDLLLHPLRTERVQVVREVTCEIPQGEFFGLLGPNGAGKTTLFKMLATLIHPDEGSARVGGFDIVCDADRVRQILAPVIASERSLLWRVSARENLKLYAALQGLGTSEATRRVDELLEIVELVAAGTKMVGEFSSGMKQRLLIARALLSKPRVLLLDEPTRSLDPISARRFRAFLREEIVDRQGCTVLLATHLAEEALELCDRVGILHRGTLLAVGSADALAREVAEDRYRLWTTEPEHRGFKSLCARGVVTPVGSAAKEVEGWTPIELLIPGGADRTADVIAFLSENGVRIARCEKVPLSLADLIERVVRHRSADSDA
ncbi:MAG: ABC transporter ATP-binding protein [Longimicrobiaceae bacterium]